jgi:serine/threonine-protein kinase SRPK3
MRRFERINNVVESVEDYRIGGYHPVHLGDLFHQRYEIIGKLAFGQFSTVWLARDQRLVLIVFQFTTYPNTLFPRLQRDVTLKILKSAVSEDSQELSILNELSHSITPHAGKEHVISLLDHFEHEGPNGLHLCLVFPIMMSDGEAMTIRGKARNASFVRAVSTQIIIGLDFLHQNNMIHGGNILNYNVKIEGILIFLLDLQPANILFTVKQARHRESLVPPEFSPVRWLPGITADSSAPRYLMTSQRPRGMLDDASFSSLVVKIGDLGGGKVIVYYSRLSLLTTSTRNSHPNE